MKSVDTNNEILLCGYCVTIVILLLTTVSNVCTAFNIDKSLLCTCICSYYNNVDTAIVLMRIVGNVSDVAIVMFV